MPAPKIYRLNLESVDSTNTYAKDNFDVLADGTLGISSNDAFPEGTNASFCTGEEGPSAKDKLEDYYFD